MRSGILVCILAIILFQYFIFPGVHLVFSLLPFRSVLVGAAQKVPGDSVPGASVLPANLQSTPTLSHVLEAKRRPGEFFRQVWALDTKGNTKEVHLYWVFTRLHYKYFQFAHTFHLCLKHENDQLNKQDNKWKITQQDALSLLNQTNTSGFNSRDFGKVSKKDFVNENDEQFMSVANDGLQAWRSLKPLTKLVDAVSTCFGALSGALFFQIVFLLRIKWL